MFLLYHVFTMDAAEDLPLQSSSSTLQEWGRCFLWGRCTSWTRSRSENTEDNSNKCKTNELFLKIWFGWGNGEFLGQNGRVSHSPVSIYVKQSTNLPLHLHPITIWSRRGGSAEIEKNKKEQAQQNQQQQQQQQQQQLRIVTKTGVVNRFRSCLGRNRNAPPKKKKNRKKKTDIYTRKLNILPTFYNFRVSYSFYPNSYPRSILI